MVPQKRALGRERAAPVTVAGEEFTNEVEQKWRRLKSTTIRINHETFSYLNSLVPR